MYFKSLMFSFGVFLLSSSFLNRSLSAMNNNSVTNTLDSFENDDYHLKYVSIIFRHGYRTPIYKKLPNFIEEIDWPSSLIETDEYTVVKYNAIFQHNYQSRSQSLFDNQRILKGGATTGTLTKSGQKLMAYKGQLLKSRYIDKFKLLNESINNSNISIFCTNFQRTIDSMRCVLSGLTESQNTNEPWKFTIYPIEADTSFPNFYFCKPLNSWNQKATLEARMLPVSIDLYNRLAENLNITAKEVPSSIELWDIIQSRETCSLPLPHILKEFYNKIHDSAVESQLYLTMGNSDLYKKLLWGNLLYRLFEDLREATNENNKVKISFLSAHDSTLIVILSSLGLFDNKWPELGSILCIELYEDLREKDPDKKWLLRFLYNDRVLAFPNGVTTINMNELRERLSKFLINKNDWLNNCQIVLDGDS